MYLTIISGDYAMNKKLRKLFRSPRHFFHDMLINLEYNYSIKKWNPFKIKDGFSKYTVITPCYNVAEYLDTYFKSITMQYLDFTNNIFLVLVDDGSTDSTAEIIQIWQSKYPNNIKYVHKENGGLSSARNAGLPFVKTPWVTFIDPDDFVNSDYFYNIDVFLKNHPEDDFAFISTNIILYFDDQNKFKNSHPLNYKFKKKENIIRNPLSDSKHIQLQAASTLFRSKIIHENNFLFSSDVKPTFEDGHFIYRYLVSCKEMPIAFLKKSKYFYRKRSSKNSLVDKSWLKKSKFDDVLRYGYLDLLTKYKSSRYLYNLVLYDLMWQIKYIINSPEKISFLTEQEKNNYLMLLDKIFSHIPDWAIMPFDLAGCWYYYKVGILHCFKHTDVPEQNILYIEAYDAVKNEVRLRYFYGTEHTEKFYLNDEEVQPKHKKIVRDDFCGRTFVYQKIIWLPLGDDPNATFHCSLNGLFARISFDSKQYSSLKVTRIKSFFYKFNKSMQPHWIVMDRNNQADDNAEHLYRWLMKNHPEQEAFFVLNKDSYDWPRLEQEGFNLLAYGSPEHEEKLLTCSKIISSQIDHYVVNYFNNSSTAHIPFIFLQHGVIKDDLSRWLNGKKRIDLFVTSAHDEYNSIAGDNNRYKLTDKEVRLLGLPRHDTLLSPYSSKNEILVMPTWRNYLAGEVISGNIRASNPNFMDSQYAIFWSNFLRSPRLYEIAKKFDYKIIFYPHPNVQQYLDQFNLPKYVLLKHQYEGSIQKMFRDTSIMITDYSSVAMEMAYLNKAIIYYQFDEKEFFSGNHVYQKGYFDYRKNGFGPVATSEDEVLDELNKILHNNCHPSELYLERMNSFFAFRDGKCCERVYNAICDLDKK